MVLHQSPAGPWSTREEDCSGTIHDKSITVFADVQPANELQAIMDEGSEFLSQQNIVAK